MNPRHYPSEAPYPRASSIAPGNRWGARYRCRRRSRSRSRSMSKATDTDGRHWLQRPGSISPRMSPTPALLEREDCTLVAWDRCFTHLAREGVMTVTIGRRELMAELGCATGT